MRKFCLPNGKTTGTSHRRRIVLLSLSFYQDETAAEHPVATQGLHALRLYALRSPVVQEGCQINIARLNFGEKAAFGKGTNDERWNSIFEPHLDVLGLSCEPWSLTFVEQFIGYARQRNPSVRIWVGGDYALHLLARRRVRFTTQDLVFPGAAGFVEFPFRKALEALVQRGTLEHEELPGVFRFEDDGTPKMTGPAVYVPLAERLPHYFDPAFQINFVYHYFHLPFSQGCPLRCRFCTLGRWKCGSRKIVDYVPKRHVSEGLRMAREGGFRKLWLDGTHINESPRRMARLMKELDDGSFDHIRVLLLFERLSDEQIALLRSLTPGRFDFEFGIQTLSPAAARAIRRRVFPISVIAKRLGALTEHQRVSVDYIYPLPGESPEEVRRHVESLLAIPGLQVRINQLLLPAGSDFGDEPHRWGFVVEDVDGYPFAVGSAEFSTEDMERMEAWIEDMRQRYGERLEPTTMRSWLEHRGMAPSIGTSEASLEEAFFKRVSGAVERLGREIGLVRYHDRIEVHCDAFPETTLIITPFVPGRAYYSHTDQVGIYYIGGQMTEALDRLISRIMDGIRAAFT